MNRRILIIEAITAIVAIGLGFLFHFTFEFLNSSKVAAPFFPVNESVWEHLKLIFYPLILTALGEYFLLNKPYKSFIAVKTAGIWLAIIFTVFVYYIFYGIAGIKENMAVTLTIYILSFALEVYFVTKYLPRPVWAGKNRRNIAIFVLVMTALLFGIFTFAPPHIQLFFDPMHKTYSLACSQ